MMDNFNYNLLEEITVRSKSIYRYETFIKEARAAKCFECTEVWREMRRRQEEELDILLQHFKKHIDAGMVDFGSE